MSAKIQQSVAIAIFTFLFSAGAQAVERCDALLFVPPEQPSLTKAAKDLLSGDTSAIGRYRNQRREFRTYAEAQRELQITKERETKIIAAQLTKLGQEFPEMIPFLNKSEAAIEAEIRDARSKLEIGEILKRSMTAVMDERIKTELLMGKRSRTIKSLYADPAGSIRGKTGQLLTDLAKTAAGQVAFAKSVEEVDAIVNDYETHANRVRREFEASERLRKNRETRYDVAISGNSKEILTSTLEAFAKEGSKVRALSPAEFQTLHQLMESNPDVKQFVYRELQFVRRAALLNGRDASAPEALAGRIANNMGIFRRIISSGDIKLLHQVMATRTSLRRISNSKKLGLARRLTRVETEQILIDAMASRELTAAVISSALVLPRLPAKPKVPVKPPLKPNLPSAPSKPYSRTRSAVLDYRSKVESYKTSYKRAVESFKSSWARYRIEVAKYKEDALVFNKAVVDRQGISLRRDQARNGLIGYLALKVPGLLGARQAKVIETVEKTADRARATLPAKYTSDARMNSSRSDDSAMNSWFMFYITGNPMWLISPEVAMIQTLFDVMSGVSNSIQSHALQGLHPTGQLETRDVLESKIHDTMKATEDLKLDPLPSLAQPEFVGDVPPMTNDIPGMDVAIDRIEQQAEVGTEQAWVTEDIATVDALDVTPDIEIPTIDDVNVDIPDVDIPDISVEIDTSQNDFTDTSAYDSGSYDTGSIDTGS